MSHQHQQSTTANANNHHQADSTFTKMSNMAHEYGDKINKISHQAKEQATELGKSFESTIQDHPFTSLGVALVTGLVIGAILKS